MKSVIEVKTRQELEKIIEDNSVVLVNFGAKSWCVPCQRLSPHYLAAAEKLPDVAFVEIDVDTADRDLVELFSVQSVPTVKVFKDGKFVKDSDARTAIQLIAEARS